MSTEYNQYKVFFFFFKGNANILGLELCFLKFHGVVYTSVLKGFKSL